MNVFEKHFDMLKKNENIFEQCKIEEMNNNINENYKYKGIELLDKKRCDEFMQVRSIHYSNIIFKRLDEFNFPEWIICIEEKVLLDYAVPIFLKVLEKYPMLCGMHCEWEILYEIIKIEEVFWINHIDWKENLNAIIKDDIFNYEKKLYNINYEYIEQFKKYIYKC